MIHREDPYGWGVFRVPMARDVAGSSGGSPGHPVADTGRDLPWRLMGISLLLSLLALSGIILLHRVLPEPLVEPPPLKIVVRILQEAPEPPPAPPEKVARKPLPAPPQPARTEPEPVPDPPAAVTLEPERAQAIVPPPRPVADKPVARREPAPTPVKPLPERKSLPEATLPVAPPVAEYQREVSEAELPEEQTTFARRDQRAEVIEPAAPATVERRPVQVVLPETATVPFGTYSRADVPPPAARLPGSGRAKNRSVRPSSLAGSPVNMQAGGEEIDLPAPTDSLTANRSDDSRPPTAGGPKMAKFSTGGVVTVSLPGSRQGEASRSQAAETEGLSQSFERLDRLGRGELDPSVAMSLSRLRTCRDPESEMTLKSRLASMLGNPARCRSGGVVFDIRNAESAYSTHIDIYNYEGREFKDRCAALNVAIDACTARRE